MIQRWQLVALQPLAFKWESDSYLNSQTQDKWVPGAL